MFDGGGSTAVERDPAGLNHQDTVHVQGKLKVMGGHDDLLAEARECGAEQLSVTEVKEG